MKIYKKFLWETVEIPSFNEKRVETNKYSKPKARWLHINK